MIKASLFLLITVAICTTLQAQKVGINVTSPSENLHVDSTIKVGKNATLGTNGRKNLIKFGDGDYVTIGEENRDDKLYIRYGDLIFMGTGASVSSGYIGINTETPTANLDINGTLRIRGNGAAAGKVLTSDASGNATWQAGAAAMPVVHTYMSGGSIVLNTTNEIQIPLGNNFQGGIDTDNGINPSTGEYVVPSTGIYNFLANCLFQGNNTATTVYVSLYVYTTAGGLRTGYTKQEIVPAINSVQNVDVEHTFQLTAGERIRFVVGKPNSGSPAITVVPINSSRTYFRGFKIR